MVYIWYPQEENIEIYNKRHTELMILQKKSTPQKWNVLKGADQN